MKNISSSPTINFAPASLFRRIAAAVYDSLIIFSFLLLATAVALIAHQGKSFLPIKTYFLTYLFLTTGGFLSWFWQRSGQTLGMLAWKIKVVDQHNQPLTWSKAFMRYIVGFITLGCGGLGILWCLWDKDKQALYDRLTRSKVIHLKK